MKIVAHSYAGHDDFRLQNSINVRKGQGAGAIFVRTSDPKFTHVRAANLKPLTLNSELSWRQER